MTHAEAVLANKILRTRTCYLGPDRCELIWASDEGATLYCPANACEYFARWDELSLQPSEECTCVAEELPIIRCEACIRKA